MNASIRKHFAAGLASGLLMAGLMWAKTAWPAPTTRACAAITARVAGWYFRTPVVAYLDGFIIESHVAAPMYISPACSGFTFFSLCLAMMTYSIATSNAPHAWRRAALFLPALCAVCIVANASRVVVSAYAQAAAVAWFPPDAVYAAHRAAGMSVFVPVLIAFHMLTQSRRIPCTTTHPAAN